MKANLLVLPSTKVNVMSDWAPAPEMMGLERIIDEKQIKFD